MGRRESLGGQEQYQPFDAQDQAALHALDDDFAISGDGEVATITGEMEVVMVRPADGGGARFRLTL